MLDSNKDFADPTKFNGVQFYGKIKRMNRDKTGKLLFGDQWPEVQNLAKSLAYGGVKKIDDATLQRIIAQNPDAGIVQTLRSVRDAQVGLEEASQSKTNFAFYVQHLIIHGILHLLGYDHSSDPDATLMEDLERRILGNLSLKPHTQT